MRRTLALATLFALTGCADYMANRDSVTLGVGNAMLANAAIHSVAAFPPNAHDTTIYTSGSRVQGAMERYTGTRIGRGGGQTDAARISGGSLPGMGVGNRTDLDCED